MNKKILTISLVAVAAITASVATALTVTNIRDADLSISAKADPDFKFTFTKDSFSGGTFDAVKNTQPFTLSTTTNSGFDFKTVDYDSSTWAGTYAYVADPDDVDLDTPDELFNVTISDTEDMPYIAIEFKVFDQALFDDENSYVSFSVGATNRTAYFYEQATDEEGYTHYTCYPDIYGSAGTVISIKYVYVTYYC